MPKHAEVVRARAQCSRTMQPANPEGRVHIFYLVYSLFKLLFQLGVHRRGNATRSPIVVPIGPVAMVTSSHS